LDVTVAAVQLAPRRCTGAVEVAALLHDPVVRAARAGARLVVLPYLGPVLAAGGAHAGEAACAVAESSRRAASEPEIPEGVATGRAGEDLVEAARQVAREAGVYLALGLPGEGPTGVLLGPDGTVVGRQRQTHVLPDDRKLGLLPGDRLFVFLTEVGRLGMLVGTDAWYPEVSRILALRGRAGPPIPAGGTPSLHFLGATGRYLAGSTAESNVRGGELPARTPEPAVPRGGIRGAECRFRPLRDYRRPDRGVERRPRRVGAGTGPPPRGRPGPPGGRW
jgi:hypothetical protein